MSHRDLDEILLALEVTSAGLRECCATEEQPVRVAPSNYLFLFYNTLGSGRLVRTNHAPIEFPPHALVMVRPEHELRIEAAAFPGLSFFQASFRTSLGGLMDPFVLLSEPVVAQFSAADRLDSQLEWALSEFQDPQTGAEVVIGSLLKLILVSVARRSLARGEHWIQRLALLEDRRINGVLNNMIATPGARHSIQTMAELSHMSRSAFIARFTSIVGHSPMAALRQLRMRRAAVLLSTGGRSVERIARHVGYSSRSSFVRAFVDTFGTHPGAYRQRQRPSDQFTGALR